MEFIQYVNTVKPKHMLVMTNTEVLTACGIDLINILVKYTDHPEGLLEYESVKITRDIKNEVLHVIFSYIQKKTAGLSRRNVLFFTNVGYDYDQEIFKYLSPKNIAMLINYSFNKIKALAMYNTCDTLDIYLNDNSEGSYKEKWIMIMNDIVKQSVYRSKNSSPMKKLRDELGKSALAYHEKEFNRNRFSMYNG